MKIVVVKSDPARTGQGLLEDCRKQRNGDETPRMIEFRAKPPPKINLGTILRSQLRDKSATTHCAVK